MTKAGGGTLVLTGTNPLTGGVTVAAGTLQLGAGGTGGSLTGDVLLGAGATLAVDRSDAVTLAGAISGTGGVAKRGSGVLTLTGAGSATGGTTVVAGSLVVGNGAAAGSIAATAPVDVAGGALLAFDRSDAIGFAGRVTGPGTVEQRGTGTLTLSRSGPYGDAFTLRVAAGTADLNRAGNSLVGILGLGNTVQLAGGTLQLTSNAGPETRLADAAISVQASSTIAVQRLGGSAPADHVTTDFATPITVANGSTLAFDFRGEIPAGFRGQTTYSAPVTLASTATFSVANSAGGTAEVIFGGPVGDGAAGHGLVKAGPQRLTLAAANTYAGPTTVAAGTLALGLDGSIAASPQVRIASGAALDVSAKTAGYAVPAGQTLTGAGSVVGATGFAAGGTVAPGDVVGTLTTTGNVSFGGGGGYNWQVLDALGTAGATTGWDLLTVGGTLAITATPQDPFAINLWSLSAADPVAGGAASGFDPTRAATWRIASATTISGFAADAFRVVTQAANGTSGFINQLAGGSFGVAASGTDLSLVFTPAPPSSNIVIDVPSGSQTQSQAGHAQIQVADSVTKTGAGELVMDAANGYTGPTTVSGGTLQVANAGAVASSPVTVASGATLSVASGTTMKTPSVTVNGGTVSAGTLAVNAATGVAALTINSGTIASTTAVVVGPGGLVDLPDAARVSVGVASLAVDQTAGGGKVDLGSGQVTIAAGGITAADLRADIIAGRSGGSWTGAAGITSAAAAAAPGTRAVGYTVAGNGTAKVSFSAHGDTNLDGLVNFSDIQAIINGGRYGQSGTTGVWANGDFNYDGLVNFTDIQLLLNAGAYGQASYFPSAPSGASGGGLGAPVAVPEPGTTVLLVVAAAAAGFAIRRRR